MPYDATQVSNGKAIPFPVTAHVNAVVSCRAFGDQGVWKFGLGALRIGPA